MARWTRRSFLMAGGAAAALTASQLHRSRPAKAQANELNLYSSRHYNTDDALYDGFTEATGIRINLIEGSADALLERIINEGSNSPADIFMTVDAGRLWRAAQANVLAPVSSSVLESKIPASLRDPDGLWFGFSKRARVMIYNKDRVNPANLSTYENLVDPQWRGRILIRSSTNIYNQSLVAGLMEVNGAAAMEDWAEGMVANFARPPEGNDTAQIEAAAAGLGDIAIANTYYLVRMGKSNDPQKRAAFDQLGVFYPTYPGQPDRGVHVNISGAGVLRSAPNPDAAVAFLEYLTDEAAQKFFAEGNNEYPVVAGTSLDPVLASLGDFDEDNVRVEAYGRNAAEALQIMDRAGWI
ncbi:MAG: Fe(3+) ABC transporter substrate-binding protein [Cyanobacteria bacterium J06638_28]